MAKGKDKDKTDDEADDAAASESEPDVQETIWRLARGQRRMSWVLLILLLTMSGVSGFQIVALEGRLDAVQSGAGQRADRAFDDFARIQDQTAAIRGGVELLHREMVKLRAQVDAVARRQNPREV